ncbi:hypothetical protein C8F04DRAFT_1179660 [Mycena alexandri]|uniref:Uncharacterized protein n=1 Tax=Mycena alexandri TaxID=1745969 RepID=A0AAD6X7U9_9AGAR|nr:hypothetical protein C8F04DRAFT_1179660 [Mycena alexandri]
MDFPPKPQYLFDGVQIFHVRAPLPSASPFYLGLLPVNFLAAILKCCAGQGRNDRRPKIHWARAAELSKHSVQEVGGAGLLYKQGWGGRARVLLEDLSLFWVTICEHLNWLPVQVKNINIGEYEPARSCTALHATARHGTAEVHGAVQHRGVLCTAVA